MKFLSLLFFLVLSVNSAFAAGGGGGGNSPFMSLNPPIIVNIVDGQRIRHMQVIVELKMTKLENAAKVQLHKGAVRHELILLLSSQDSTTISSAMGKEQLRKEALAAVQKTLEKLEGEPLVDALYFTNFIIQ